MTLRDPLTEWSELLVDSLAKAGVRDVVLSPGSRSTPFVLAAAKHPLLRCFDVIDERSAAFFALGQAKAAGRPSLVLCTSGSAGTHFFPAVIEAAMSFTPLLLLTADRPLELQDGAAPQTIDQLKLFGDHVRGFFELGLPDLAAGPLRALRRRVVQAVHTAQWPTPGPVHLNARARKPLEPQTTANDSEREMAQRAQAQAAMPIPHVHAARMVPSPEGLDALASRLVSAERPLIVAGPGPLSQSAARASLAILVRRSGAVLLREAASQLRFGMREGVDGFDLFVDAEPFCSSMRPDLIVMLGGPPTSTALSSYLATHAAVPRWVGSPHGWNDPESAASEILMGHVEDIVEGLVGRLPDGRSVASVWQRRWQQCEEVAQRAIDGWVDEGAQLTEGAAARIVGESLQPGQLLFIGNSLAIRDVDLFCSARVKSCGVLSQRGANGIDGLVSGAAGAASTGIPVTLVLGDISFLHDVGGCWAARLAGSNLTVVILENGGGRIFEDLPLARANAEAALSHFTTPHDEIRIEPVGAMYGLAYRKASTVQELRAALAPSREEHRARVIEAVLPHEGLEPTRRLLRQKVAARLAEMPP